MRTRAVSSSPRAHSILLTCRCTSSVREARRPLRDNNHGQTASHLCQEFWSQVRAEAPAVRVTDHRLLVGGSDRLPEQVGGHTGGKPLFDRGQRGHGAYALPPCDLLAAQVLVMDDVPLAAGLANAAPDRNGHVVLRRIDVA